jgi:hypothetical protein
VVAAVVVVEVVAVDEVDLVAVEEDVEVVVVVAVQDASNAAKKVTCLANAHQVIIFLY